MLSRSECLDYIEVPHPLLNFIKTRIEISVFQMDLTRNDEGNSGYIAEGTMALK